MYELTSINDDFQAGIYCLAGSESSTRIAGDAPKSISGGSEDDDKQKDGDSSGLHDGTSYLQ